MNRDFVLTERRAEPLRYIKQSKISMTEVPEGNEKEKKLRKL